MQYRAGNVDVTNGSATVIGNGTEFLANVDVGDDFLRTGDGVIYDVADVVSDTEITLSATYQGVTGNGVTYTIQRDFTANYDFPYLSQGDIETATITARATKLIDATLDSAIDADIDVHKSESSAHDAVNIDYDNSTSGLAATDVQAAIDEHVGSTDGHPDATTTDSGFMSASDKTKLDGVESGATADQDASEVPYSNTSSGLTATDVQAAIDENDGRLDTAESKLDTIETGATADQNANEVPYDNATSGLAATDVQAAIDEDVANLEAHESAADPHTQYAELSGGADANFTAMPQVGGDPIVESGSNSDGDWTKWADGTMICTADVSFGSQSTEAFGNIFTSTVETFPYPVSPAADAHDTGQGSSTAAWLGFNRDNNNWVVRMMTETSRTVDRARLVTNTRWY